ncbi:MAG TPA: LysR family transcriptional regulator [Oculatellaceae cyanobacterium]|jgi:DNA-binding transcriptional LysR family regulator
MTIIHEINLAGIDLNLLVVFNALMNERHVTRAGERLGLSQPATSNALARLRNLIKDDLFIRTATGLQPTPKAIALAQQIQPALQQIKTALSGEEVFDASTSDRIFAIGMTDYTEFTLLPSLMEKLQTVAPNVKIQIRSGDRQKLLSLLDSGEIQIACGLFPEKIAWHAEELIFQENFVCVCRSNHPNIKKQINLEQYLAAEHLLVSIKEDMVGRIDELLAAKNLQRRIVISVPHFLVVPFIVARTNLVASLAERVAATFANIQDLQVLTLPLSTEGFSIFIRWHRSTENHPAYHWLRTTIIDISKNI